MEKTVIIRGLMEKKNQVMSSSKGWRRGLITCQKKQLGNIIIKGLMEKVFFLVKGLTERNVLCMRMVHVNENFSFRRENYACMLYEMHVGMQAGDWFLDWSPFF